MSDNLSVSFSSKTVISILTSLILGLASGTLGTSFLDITAAKSWKQDMAAELAESMQIRRRNIELQSQIDILTRVVLAPSNCTPP